MNASVASVLLAIVLGSSASASAQAPSGHAHHPKPAQASPASEIPASAKAAVAVADRFSKALAAGDFKTVEQLLAADVLILETGGAERSRAEYLGHHAISDAQFLKGAHSELKRRRARVDGGLAWIGSESELHATKDGKALTLLSTETMVLKKVGADWRIAHILWSSRPKKAN